MIISEEKRKCVVKLKYNSYILYMIASMIKNRSFPEIWEYERSVQRSERSFGRGG